MIKCIRGLRNIGIRNFSRFDVINIYKDKADPSVKPLKEYPEWLATLLNDQRTNWELLSDMRNGYQQDMTPTQARSLYRWLKKQKIIQKNLTYVKGGKQRFKPQKKGWLPEQNDVHFIEEHELEEEYWEEVYSSNIVLSEKAKKRRQKKMEEEQAKLAKEEEAQEEQEKQEQEKAEKQKQQASEKKEGGKGKKGKKTEEEE